MRVLMFAVRPLHPIPKHFHTSHFIHPIHYTVYSTDLYKGAGVMALWMVDFPGVLDGFLFMHTNTYNHNIHKLRRAAKLYLLEGALNQNTYDTIWKD